MKNLSFVCFVVLMAFTSAPAARVFTSPDAKAGTVSPNDSTGIGVCGSKPAKPKAAKEQRLEGTFVRIDEGDYFHWVMKSKSGEEQSFFIFKSHASIDAVIDSPEAYVGKKCRIFWKKSTEDIPEAGGKMEIDQILRVEWITAAKPGA